MYILKLEAIGETSRLQLRAAAKIGRILPGTYRALYGRAKSSGWCAKLSAKNGILQRSFIKPLRDYSGSSGNGNRGIILTYFLHDGYYDVFERTSWRHSDRYFLHVCGRLAKRISSSEVDAWSANQV